MFFSAAGFASAGGQSYTLKNCFSLTVPGGWSREAEPYGLSDSEKKVYGTDFLAPDPGQIPVRISVKYYAPGNLVQPTYEKYIKTHASSALGANLDKKVYGKVTSGKAGNYYAKVFERKVFEYFPKRSLKAKKIYIYEKFYVVPVKHGFYVLRYTSPMNLARANLKTFESSAATFRPLIR